MKYKVFFTFIFLIVLIFFSACDSKAVTILGEEFPDFPTDLPSEYKYTYITYDDDYDYYYLFFTDEPAYISRAVLYDNGLIWYVLHYENSIKYRYIPKSNQSSWEYQSSNPYDNNYIYLYENGGFLDNSYHIVFASESIFFDLDSSSNISDLDGDVYFYESPYSEPLSTIWPIDTNLWQSIAKLLLVVIPIIVIYIGIRKGISFIRTNLIKS